MSCCDGWYYTEEELTHVEVKPCPKCGEDTVDGQAVSGCNWSSVSCEECGDAPCDGSC